MPTTTGSRNSRPRPAPRSNVVFIGTDDEIWAKIKGSEGKDFDVFAVNTAQLQRYIDAGLVTPYDLDQGAEPEGGAAALPRPDARSRGVTRDGKVYGIPFCLRFHRPHLRHRQGEAGARRPWTILWDPKYKGKVLAYDNGEHNFSFTALTLGIKDPFHLTAEQMAAGQGEADRPQAQCAELLHHRRRGAADLQEQRRGADLGQLRPAAGQGHEGCRRPCRLCQCQGRGARLARHLGDDQRRAATRIWPRPGSTSCCRRRSASSSPSAPASATRSCRDRPAPGSNDKLVWLAAGRGSDQALRSLERDQGDAVTFGGTLSPGPPQTVGPRRCLWSNP